jgi:hypothetical protein
MVKSMNAKTTYNMGVNFNVLHDVFQRKLILIMTLRIQWASSYNERLPPQMMFVTVTGDHLILNTRRFAIYVTIIFCVSTPLTVSMHFVPPYLEYWQIPCYTVSYLVVGMFLCTVRNIFLSLFRAATLLNSCFKVRNNKHFMYDNTSELFAHFCAQFL